MIIAHYEHHLPAGYDLNIVRRRTAERASIWDSVPNLFFKAFVLREAGRFGAASNSYSSFYLWRRDEAYREWLVGGGYQIVINSFGRANIETLVAIDALRGSASEARFLYREDVSLSPDADLTRGIANEIEFARAQAALPGTVAAVVGLDTQRWNLPVFFYRSTSRANTVRASRTRSDHCHVRCLSSFHTHRASRTQDRIISD